MEAPSIEDLARTWRANGRRRGLPAAGWRIPAIRDVTEALSRTVVDPAELADAAQMFGADRSACGFTFEQCLNDVDSLLDVVGQQWCPLLYRYVTLGWDRCRSGIGVTLYDPLTQLTSADYFLMRLRETYRGIDCGMIAADRHVLCVAQLHSTGAFLDLELGMMATSSALHAAFNGPQTISKFGSSSCVVLEVDDDRRAPGRSRRPAHRTGSGEVDAVHADAPANDRTPAGLRRSRRVAVRAGRQSGRLRRPLIRRPCPHRCQPAGCRRDHRRRCPASR